MSGIHVYIIHGYGAAPQDHWFPWLRQKLQEQGARVSVLALPHSAEPEVHAWDRHLAEHVQAPDENTFFVTHSLGSITTLRYLSRLDAATRVGGIVAVSGFAEPIAGFGALDPFVAAGAYSPERIKASVPQRAVIGSENDAIVPIAATERLSRAIDATLHRVKAGGHFLGAEGFTELPLAYELLLAMLPTRAQPTPID